MYLHNRGEVGCAGGAHSFGVDFGGRIALYDDFI